MNHLVGHVRHLLNKTHNITKGMRLMSESSTYKRKYQGLPPDTPVPEIKSKPNEKWQFCELLAGSGKLTKACKETGLVCGPPISWETGWCMKIPKHRERLFELLTIHCPDIVFAAPCCSIWSVANTTMQPHLKQAIKVEELIVFDWLCRVHRFQHSQHRFYVYEQPKTSELLRLESALAVFSYWRFQFQFLKEAERFFGPFHVRTVRGRCRILRGAGQRHKPFVVWALRH